MKELANSTRSTSSVVDFFVVIIEMLFEFVCQFLKLQHVALEDVLSE